MKKTILHFIFDLARGGAETMLVQVIKELPEYNHIVVTLYPANDFKTELQCSRLICLNQKSLLFFPFTASKLRRIIRENNVSIVHNHLFWPMIIARMGVPKNIPLVSTIHAFIATSVEYRFWHVRLLDKVTYHFRKSIIVAVAKGAAEEYFSFLKLKPYKSFALYTFVNMQKFSRLHIPSVDRSKTFRIISIGALRVQKNHRFLVNAFRYLKDEPVELHIFGAGPLREDLQKIIDENQLKVELKGVVENMNEILPDYDLLAMSSTFEGFSLAVLETMAVKVPMLLSDIVSFREQCEDAAVFFALNDTNDFVLKLKTLIADEKMRYHLAERAYQRVSNNFTLPKHVEQLRGIYKNALNEN